MLLNFGQIDVLRNRTLAFFTRQQSIHPLRAPHFLFKEGFAPITLPSAQSRQGHTHRIALRFPLSPTRGEGKEECVGDMNQNIFNDTDFSFFTSLFSLNTAGFDTDFASCYLPNKQLQKRRAKENYSNNYSNNRSKHHRSC